MSKRLIGFNKSKARDRNGVLRDVEFGPRGGLFPRKPKRVPKPRPDKSSDLAFWKREAKETLRQLKRERRDAMDTLNNQRETIAELQARAVPEGWRIDSASQKRDGILLVVTPSGSRYNWQTLFYRIRRGGQSEETIPCVNRTTSSGVAATFNEAVQQAEKAGKKVKR